MNEESETRENLDTPEATGNLDPTIDKWALAAAETRRQLDELRTQIGDGTATHEQSAKIQELERTLSDYEQMDRLEKEFFDGLPNTPELSIFFRSSLQYGAEVSLDAVPSAWSNDSPTPLYAPGKWIYLDRLVEVLKTKGSLPTDFPDTKQADSDRAGYLGAIARAVNVTGFKKYGWDGGSGDIVASWESGVKVTADGKLEPYEPGRPTESSTTRE